MLNDEDDANAWKALSAIRPLAEDQNVPHGLPAGEEEIRRALRQACIEQPSIESSVQGRLTKLIGLHSAKLPRVEACVEWLRKTGQFSEKELDLIRRFKLIYQTATGHIFLRKQRLSKDKAAFLLSLLAFIAGVWVGWVLFSDHTGLQQIANSYAFGTIFGTGMRYVLDLSFRFARMHEKILGVAPWLQEPEPQQ